MTTNPALTPMTLEWLLSDDGAFVALALGQERILMQPIQARQLAAWLVQCSETAELEGLLLGALRGKRGWDKEAAMAFIADIRAYREDVGKLPPPPVAARTDVELPPL
jgi:hypothetical protein